MTTRRVVLGLLAGGAAFVLSGCGFFRPSEELRYRLTIEVDTPEGLKTGFSVIAVSGVTNPGWVTPEGRGNRYSFRGEAASVDLPGGRTLFALLKTESELSDAADYPWSAFGAKLSNLKKDAMADMRLMRSWTGQSAAITGTQKAIGSDEPVSALPMLVTFRDNSDPKSVERVDPANLSATFGQGVRLRSVIVTITNDDVTVGLEKRLKWLGHLEDYRTDKTNPFTSTLAREIGSFSQGVMR